MGPDNESAEILLLTFKTKIEEAISLVNQMPENMRQEAWQFWQKVSSAMKAATVGIKKRKPVPGGKEIMARRPKADKRKKTIYEPVNDDDEVVEEFIIDSPVDNVVDASHSAGVSNVPIVTVPQDPLAQDLKLLYSSVYSKETAEAVEAMITGNETPVVISVEDTNPVVPNSPPQTTTETINVVVQDIVNDQVITSLVTIDNPSTPLKKSPQKQSPKTMPPKKPQPKKKSKKKDKGTITDEFGEVQEASIEGADETVPSPVKSPKKRKPRKKKVPESDDIVSKALAESTLVLQSDELGNVCIKTETDDCDPNEPMEPKEQKEPKKPRRSSRPPKPKKKPKDQEVGGEEEGGEKIRKKRVHVPGEPKQEPGPVICTVCGLELAYYSSLAAHMRKHTGDRPFICSICCKPFTTKANMLRHERTHSGEKPFECEQCNKCFTEKKTLKVHMRSHTGERPFKCPDCGVGFTQSGTLKSHMHRHTGHKGNLCDLCGRAFRQKSQLKLHLKRHFNLKPHKCGTCQLPFYSRGDLIRHEMRHTGARPFACSQCPKTFTRLTYLKEHENHHNGITPYSCDKCPIRFSDHSSYYRHLQRHKKKAEAEDSVHLVVDSEAMDDAAVDSVPALLVTADHIQHLLGVNSTNSGEVYRIALVDQTGEEDASVAVDQTQADFSAINLLASATTQLSMSQEAEADLKQIGLPHILN